MSTAYFNADGRLIALVKESEELTAPESAVASATVPDATLANDIYYSFADSMVKIRATMMPVVTRNSVSNLPIGTLAHFDNNTITVMDGSLDFDADIEEEISVYLQHEEYRPSLIKVQTGP